MLKRLKSNVEPFTPKRFIELREEFLRSLGLTRQKSHYCVQVAYAFTEGRLNKISRMSDEEAQAALVSIKGIGPWSANVYLLMALKRPDIWPTGDVALATAVGKLRTLSQRPSFHQLAEMAEAWRPFRSVAARMLWQYYLARRDKREK
jgi:DNA-3-methyladenine glycosylase II